MTDEPRAADQAAAAGTDDAAGRDRPKLTRAREHKVLAGVCQGGGRYFGVDPVIFRIVLLVLALTGGIGLIVYGMGWLLLPQDDERESEAHRLLSGRIEGAPLAAVLMALAGCGLYASMIGNGTNQAFSLILLTATAGAVYWSQRRHRVPAAGQAPAPGSAASAVVDAPPAVKAPPEPGGSPSWWREPAAREPYLWGPDDGPYGDADRVRWRARTKEARRERSWVLGLLTFLLAVGAAWVGAAVAWPAEPAATSVEIGLAAALGVFGTAFVIASFAGRARGGTVFFSLVTLAGLIAVATVPKTGQGVGGTTWRPADAGAVRATYERGAGTGTLDLTALNLDGRTVAAHLNIGAGRAVVLLPRNATVRLDYDLDLGEVVLPGKANDGVDIKHGQHRTVTFAPAPGTLPGGTVDLRVTIGVGQLKVVR
ncbi:PspC domain-containing protein [Actinacidiphila acididurans]|uniref:PspC domain-containing protein n=1 Tax=Actinacidiphila acididurans TaxID=2784346 RepID=A0ABS2TMZ2_9ACTN|nr:PspC domain-containing protein [Actinacidiphila acididurans]MBM9504707.1 PspC domain-containing protein [Actinacidiphila acididurans]